MQMKKWYLPNHTAALWKRQQKRPKAVKILGNHIIFLLSLTILYSLTSLYFYQPTSAATIITANTIIQHSSTNLIGSSKFAYVFIVSGCTATSCDNYLLNTVVAARALRDAQSNADVLLLVRMTSSSNTTKLRHESWLRQANVLLRYLPKVAVDNFGTASVEKFRALQLVNYERVVFLDSDILPICNLDYLFTFQWSSPLVIFSGPVAPATASIFLVTPQTGEFERIINVIQRQRTVMGTWNDTLGWGHVLQPPYDGWRAFDKPNLHFQWSFYASHADQGLLYYYAKYMRMNFTHVYPGSVETWRQVSSLAAAHPNAIRVDNDHLIAHVQTQHNILQGCGGLPYGRKGDYAKYAPYSDYLHFNGIRKPWIKPIDANFLPKRLDQVATARHVWLYYLGRANRTYGLNLPSVLKLRVGNPLGPASTPEDLFLPNVTLPQA